MTHLDIALWGALPYIVLVVLVAGSAWRYRYDRFGFTTRSSQIHESRLLRVGGPLFHYALLFVIGGHVTGLLVPEMVTDRLDVSENSYHDVALIMGGGAGVAAVAGLAILLYRRLRVPAVRRATNGTDRAVYPLLAAAMLGGLVATASSLANPYDYRLGVSVWFRSLFDLDPDVAAMAHAPFVYQLHALLGMAMFMLWPFSRLVHALTAPVWYLARPYVVYRSRAVPYRHPAARPGDAPATGAGRAPR
ncbi:respiratory nitrate reductase subunit gamma [Actinomadura verrucosospora]|uniref:Nitrate reductase-like protein NarX n=1 Tax=Actinomadura verrucosospora TaxID=46165 RepID=A0A7D4ALK2_ACTVE|nr:respiratory nitrate reductase subunit gamma [Actinomadura verrucosospora]QKG21428.1 nitrate reductase gamma chain NarI3 [Actinomadura verrucosospora]